MYICWVVAGLLSSWGQRSRPGSTSGTLQRGPPGKGNEVRGLSCLSFLGGWAWTWGCRHVGVHSMVWAEWPQGLEAGAAPEDPHPVLTDRRFSVMPEAVLTPRILESDVSVESRPQPLPEARGSVSSDHHGKVCPEESDLLRAIGSHSCDMMTLHEAQRGRRGSRRCSVMLGRVHGVCVRSCMGVCGAQSQF